MSDSGFAYNSTLALCDARAMFENSPLPMWTFDRETLRFMAVNEAAMRHYWYSREETRTWRHRKKDGSIITVEITANDYVSADRSVRLVLINDVTERERAREGLRKTEEQLRQAQKMDAIGQLAGGVAHDFNNVLTVIQNYAWVLEETLDPSDAGHEYVTEIIRAAERATGITKQLLTVSRHSLVAPQSIKLDEIVERPDRAGAAESRSQRARRDVWPRTAYHRDPATRGRQRECGRSRLAIWEPRGSRRHGYRYGHGSRYAGADLRAILHDQASRQGDRARTIDRSWHRDTMGWNHRAP
jgi:PAS domain-containing protein